MICHNVIDDLISNLDPKLIDPSFIIMAKLKGFDGHDYVLKGKELAQFLKAPHDFASEAKVIPDVRKMRQAIMDEVSRIYEGVNDLLDQEDAKQEI